MTVESRVIGYWSVRWPVTEIFAVETRKLPGVPVCPVLFVCRQKRPVWVDLLQAQHGTCLVAWFSVWSAHVRTIMCWLYLGFYSITYPWLWHAVWFNVPAIRGSCWGTQPAGKLQKSFENTNPPRHHVPVTILNNNKTVLGCEYLERRFPEPPVLSNLAFSQLLIHTM